jgi:tetratricopeptide (TPR) repeat protein
LRTIAPHVPAALVDIVERCLVKDPAGRYASAALLRDDLRRCAAQLPSADPSEAETRLDVPSLAARRQRRLSPRTAAIAAVALLMIVLAAFRGPALMQWLRTRTSPPAPLADAQASPQELYSQATERLRFYYREGNIDAAIEQLNRALALKSPYPLAEARLSLAYWRKDSISADPEWQKRALAHAERAVDGNGQLAVAHIAHGAALTLAGKVDDAAAAFQEAETLEPRNWELMWRLGDLEVKRKNPTAAEPYFRRATESAPQEWESHSRFGTFLYQQGRYQDAIASFVKMRELARDHARAYSNLAAAYHQLGRTDESAEVLQRALEIAPDGPTYSNLGTYLYFQGKYHEAERAFDEAIKLNANAYQRWGNLGDAVRMTARGGEKMHESYKRAIQLARAELAKRPDPDIRSSLALYLARDGQIKDALAEIDPVVAQASVPPAVLFKGALVAEVAGDRKKSLRLVRQALEAGYQIREIAAEPDLVQLRADPEYHRLVSRYEK